MIPFWWSDPSTAPLCVPKFNELNDAGNYPAALVEAQKLEAGIKARFGINHINYAVARLARLSGG